jgi:hypothetical protein
VNICVQNNKPRFAIVYDTNTVLNSLKHSDNWMLYMFRTSFSCLKFILAFFVCILEFKTATSSRYGVSCLQFQYWLEECESVQPIMGYMKSRLKNKQGSSGSTMSNFLRNRQTDFQSGCTSLQSHQQWRSAPLSPHPRQFKSPIPKIYIKVYQYKILIFWVTLCSYIHFLTLEENRS